MTTIGFIGAGNIGSQVARQAVKHGYDVVLSNSRGPETLADLVAELGDHARAATTAEAAEAADLVVVSVPYGAIEAVPAAPLSGKVIIDTTNYFPLRDGNIAELDDQRESEAGRVQRHFADSRVVKTFNRILAAEITSTARDQGAADRRALTIFGDDPRAKQLVTEFVDSIGFDVVDGGSLDDSRSVQPNSQGEA
ncbi:NAD(P)-binding domain-containing protein [Actinomyces sp. F1_1611]